LETKTLLSQVSVGFIGLQFPPGRPIPIEAPVTPVIGMPVSPVIGTPAPPVIEMPISSLETSIGTNQKTYSPAQTVAMTFTVTNNTSETVSVPIGPSIDGFSVTSSGKTIWTSNSGVTPDFIALRTLAPGQSINLTANWSAPSMTGTFAVHNQLDPSDSATFEIGTSPDVIAAAKRARSSSPHPHHVLHIASTRSLEGERKPAHSHPFDGAR
jgi:hypothetical protein